MPDIRANIAVAQMDCVLGDVDANLNRIEVFTRSAKALGAELVIFPECATTGYFIGDRLGELAETPDGAATGRLSAIARAQGVTLICGMYTAENDKLYNSQKVFGPDGSLLATYHKVHLFSSEREIFQPGDTPVVVRTPIGKLGLTICYDLIFPEFVGTLVRMGADFIVNSTNWITEPYQRDTWGWNAVRLQGLASTRALENVIPLAMACRSGRESLPPDLVFDSIGLSCVVSPSGQVVAQIERGEGVALGRIDVAAADLDRWSGIATYRADRRPELYR